MLGRPHIPRLRPPIQSGPYTPDKPLSSFTVSAPARGCIYYGDEEAEERIIPVDFVPRILSGAEWRQLEAGLTQRVGALNPFLEDVYGEARIIADGVVPADVVRGWGLVILLYELQSRTGAGGSEKGSRRAMPVR